MHTSCHSRLSQSSRRRSCISHPVETRSVIDHGGGRSQIHKEMIAMDAPIRSGSFEAEYPSRDDEQSVRAVHHALLNGWNERNAHTMASLFLPGGHAVGFDGSQLDG